MFYLIQVRNKIELSGTTRHVNTTNHIIFSPIKLIKDTIKIRLQNTMNLVLNLWFTMFFFYWNHCSGACLFLSLWHSMFISSRTTCIKQTVWDENKIYLNRGDINRSGKLGRNRKKKIRVKFQYLYEFPFKYILLVYSHMFVIKWNNYMFNKLIWKLSKSSE